MPAVVRARDGLRARPLEAAQHLGDQVLEASEDARGALVGRTPLGVDGAGERQVHERFLRGGARLEAMRVHHLHQLQRDGPLVLPDARAQQACDDARVA